MGGNGAYIRSEGGVPVYKRTHSDTDYRVDGHKVLVLSSNPSHKKILMNSNSDNPIYLCGTADKKTGVVNIDAIGIYENHKLVTSIDIKTDKNGNFIPYDKSNKDSSHSHNWKHDNTGDVGRKAHDSSNNNPISSNFNKLINDVIKFNKEHKIWKK